MGNAQVASPRVLLPAPRGKGCAGSSTHSALTATEIASASGQFQTSNAFCFRALCILAQEAISSSASLSIAKLASRSAGAPRTWRVTTFDCASTCRLYPPSDAMPFNTPRCALRSSVALGGCRAALAELAASLALCIRKT